MSHEILRPIDTELYWNIVELDSSATDVIIIDQLAIDDGKSFINFVYDPVIVVIIIITVAVCCNYNNSIVGTTVI